MIAGSLTVFRRNNASHLQLVVGYILPDTEVAVFTKGHLAIKTLDVLT